MLDPLSWNFLDSDLDGVEIFFLVLIELTCFVWLHGKFCANVENVVEMYHNITDIKMTFYFFQLQDEKHKNGADAVRELWIYGMKIVANLVLKWKG